MKPAVLRPARNAGLTLIEVLAVVAGIAIISSVGMVATTNIQDRVAEQKLSRDVESINRAIHLYQANGGDIGTVIPHPWWILGQLKSKVTDADASTGLTGRMIDPRLQAVFMTADELSSTEPRAVWNPATLQFAVITDNSIDGAKIAGFKLTDDDWVDGLLSSYFVDRADTRSKRSFDYAKNGKWVWDYEDRAASAGSAPTEVSLSGPPAPTPAGAPPGTTQLDPPLFSIAGGQYALSSYDLSLSLANPNDPSVSAIYYSTHHGSWNLYSGTPIVVTANTQVSAVAATLDPATYTSSDQAKEVYTTTPEQLQLALSVPATMTYEEAGGAMENGGTGAALTGPGSITLANAAEIPSSYINSNRMKVMWTTDGSDPVALGALEYAGGPWPPANLFLADPFTGGFPGQAVPVALAAWGTQDSLPVQAYAKSSNPEIFTSSGVASDTVAISRSPLRAPEIANAGKTVTLTKLTAFGDMPVGARIYYTQDGTFPGQSNGEPVGGTEYTGPFDISTNTHPHCGNFSVVGKVYGPDGYGQWFNPSPSVSTMIEVPPDPGTPERFGYNFSQSDISNYAVLALGKLETKDNAQVFGNVGVGPDGKRKTESLTLNGSYDVDPLSEIDVDNASDFEGAGVSPTTVDLNQAALDAVALSAEASVLTPTQIFDKIEVHTTITSTVTNSVNVIQIKEIKMEKERVLTISGGPNDWFILNVTDKIAVKDGSIRTSGGIPASHVVINYLNNSDVQFEGDGSITGTFLAVDAKVQVKDDVTFEGTVVMGGDSKIEKDAQVIGDGNSYAFECTAEGEAVGGATDLAPPDFSIPGGTYPVNDFDLTLNLVDPNEAGAGTVFYALNGGGWTEYTGTPVAVSPATTVEAYTETNDTGRWNASATASNTYSPDLPQLDEPAIATTAPKFDGGANATVTVTITHTNGALGTLDYRLGLGGVAGLHRRFRT